MTIKITGYVILLAIALLVALLIATGSMSGFVAINTGAISGQVCVPASFCEE